MIIVFNKISPKDLFKDYQKINVELMLESDNNTDLVLFYKTGCPYCEEIEKDVTNFARERSNIQFVNTKEQKDKIESYNWKKNYELYDKEIGKVVNGKIVYNKGESAEKYIKNKTKNIFGKINVYKIVTANDEYMRDNPKAKKGYVYASLQTPNIDYSKFNGKNKLTIAGVPTLLVIKKGKISEFYFDVNEIKIALNNYKKMPTKLEKEGVKEWIE